MRRGYDPDADADGPLATDTHDLTVLDHAEESHLCRRRELPNLVKEERPSVSLFEPALSPTDGAGERARLVAKQLGVDQIGSNRPTVHAAKRALPKRGVFVNRAGDDLFARSRLSEQQDGRRAPRDHSRPGHHCGETGVATDQPLFVRAWVACDEMLWNRGCASSEDPPVL
jgi:hypothetical protein